MMHLFLLLLFYFVFFTSSFVVTLSAIFLLIRIAHRWKWLDQPDTALKSHAVAIPWVGGIALFFTFMLVVSIGGLWSSLWRGPLFGLTWLVVLGVWDDKYRISPLAKFLGQIIAVCFFLLIVPVLPLFDAFIVDLFITAFVMLSVINAFNLVDVMDGLCAVFAMLSASAFFVIALFFSYMAFATILISFIGSLLAFFWYNKPPAEVYLGNSGALFVGGFLALVPFFFLEKLERLQSPFGAWFVLAAFILIWGVPLLELCLLIVLRTWRRIPFYKGSSDHFALYLRSRGWSIRSILWFTVISGLAFSSVALLFLFDLIGMLLFIGFPVGVFFIWMYVVFGDFLFHERNF